MYLITKWFGTFLFDEKGNLKKKKLPSKKLSEIKKRLDLIDKGEVLEEEKNILKKRDNVFVSEKRLQNMGIYEPHNAFFKRITLEPEDFDFSQNLLQKAILDSTKEKVEEQLHAEDLQVVQMMDALDDLLHISNLLSERLDSWSNVSGDTNKMKPVEKTFSVVNQEKEQLEDQIKEDMKVLAPNISDLAGALVAGRLLSQAGSLKKLASMPASTIQVLGAEKALFRFKKKGGKPPKHGVIFQTSYINQAHKQVRGKIARVLANKIAIAAKADAFTGRNISEELKEELENRVKEIKRKNQ
ncbi:MAG: hypothetical protein V5A64_01175 [Candidatus Thermoplasmatota archaeon]